MQPSRIGVVDINVAEVLRVKTVEERVKMISAANRTARLLAAAGVRYQHSGWNERQVQAVVIGEVRGGTD